MNKQPAISIRPTAHLVWIPRFGLRTWCVAYIAASGHVVVTGSTVDSRHSETRQLSSQHDTVSSTCVHSAETPPANAAPSSRETLRPSIPKEEDSMAEESPGPIWGCWNRLFGFQIPTMTGRIHAPGALTKSTLLCSALYPEAARYMEHWPHLSGQPGTEYCVHVPACCRMQVRGTCHQFGRRGSPSHFFLVQQVIFPIRSAWIFSKIIILDDTTHHVSTLESLADSVLLTKFLPTVLASSEATLGCR